MILFTSTRSDPDDDIDEAEEAPDEEEEPELLEPRLQIDYQLQ